MNSDLKIAVAARGLSVESSGPVEFISGFIQALLEDGRSQIYLYYNTPAFIGRYPQAHERALPSPNRLWWDHWLLPRALRRDRVDVTILPKGTLPIWGARRPIAVIHDLGYFYPALDAYPTTDTAYMQFALRWTARRAWGIFTVSEFTRQDVLQILKPGPERVHTIYEAPNPAYRPVTDPETLARVRAHYGLDRPFIFYPTSLSPRKNIPRLLKALEQVQDRLPHQLVLTGGRAWKAGEIEARLQEPIGARVQRLGNVPPDDMPALYSLADFTVYVSLFEGFGLPVVEAFRCGSPVLISSQSCLPEVAGGAALEVDGTSVEALADGLLRLAEDETLRSHYVQLGFERASTFSWARTAELALGWIAQRWEEGRQSKSTLL